LRGKKVRCYIPDYPRPQFVRTKDSWQNLNGCWDFAFDDTREGIQKGWQNIFPAGKTIIVPFTYETEMSGIADTAPHDTVWYHRQFQVNVRPGYRVFLHFEGSDYRTEVWINNAFAGSHSGAYSRFSFDITGLSHAGENDLTVRVEDHYDLSQPRGKQRWKTKDYGCWYVQSTGIWKMVWLEEIPVEHINHIKLTPLFAKKRLAIEAELACEPGLDLELETSISFQDTIVSVLNVPVLKKNLSLDVDVVSNTEYEWGAHTWSPEHPVLYDIEFKLRRNNRVVDSVLSYFGMREIRIDGRNILLNGVPIYQRLILDQGYWRSSYLTAPDEKALINDIEKVQAAGYNGVRKHQKTEDERFLYWADVKGLLVWSEMAATYEFDDRAITNFTREWMDVVRQNYNHPSIITWTPFNESWGIPQVETNKTQQHFTEAIYHLTKSYDFMRPIVLNDGWEHTISDIITLHDYEEASCAFLERYGEHLEDILANKQYHNIFKSVFADGYAYRGQPIIISEFGGIALSGKETGWGYGEKANGKEEFLKRFDEITTAIKKISAICGYCYTQVTDVHHELNGIMDMDHVFKIDPEKLREINLRDVSNLYKLKRN
jgi:beta-galactosidase/beta-glucuronidase